MLREHGAAALIWRKRAGLTAQSPWYLSLSCSQQAYAWQHFLSPRAERRPAEISRDRASRNPQAADRLRSPRPPDLVRRLSESRAAGQQGQDSSDR